MPAPAVAATAARTGARRATGRAAARRRVGGAAAAAAALPAEGTDARRQRDAIDAIKAARPASDDQADGDQGDQAAGDGRSGEPGRRLPRALTDQRGTAGWLRPDPVKAANTGGGLALGLIAYAIGVNYLRDGKAGVKRYLMAKAFNKIEGGA
jgi:hypothetical protein